MPHANSTLLSNSIRWVPKSLQLANMFTGFYLTSTLIGPDMQGEKITVGSRPAAVTVFPSICPFGKGGKKEKKNLCQRLGRYRKVMSNRANKTYL